ncbi:MAG: hypothetical protein PHV06_00755 [bacterium]|nr:hypothetical protein [bacterium]
MRKIFCVVFSIILFSLPLFAEKYLVALFPFENLGLNEADYKIASHLLRDELENIETFELISEDEITKIAGETKVIDAKTALEYGKRLNADKCVIGSIVPLGKKVVIRFKLINVHDNNIEFFDEVESETIGDLNVVIRRVAMGLETRQKFESTATIDTVTEDELTGLKKRQSFHCYGLRLGFTYPQDGTYGGEDRLNSFYGTWQFEVPKVISQIDFGMSASTDVLDMSFDIAFLFPLTRTDFSPFLSLGLGIHFLSIIKEMEDDIYGFTTHDWEGKSGFTLSAGTGVILFRTYNFRIIFDCRAYYSFIDLVDNDAQFAVGFNFGLLMRHKEKTKSL